MTMRTNSGLWIAGALALLLCTARPAFCATTIDIMLVYDTTAKTWVDSNGGMSAFSADVVARMNQATANSGLDLTFRLAHSVAASYTHSDFSTDLKDLQDGSGTMSEVHTLRNTYKADLVAMLVDTGSAYGYTGLGYILTTYSGSPDYGFTVNSIQSVEISHTVTHEVGHNLGGGHSKYQSTQPGPNSDLNSYSAGWYFTASGTKYHTIMAYNSDGYGNYYEPVSMFSTPLKSYLGTTAGSAADGDNTRTINDTMGVVSEYRSGSPTPDPTPNPNAYLAYVNAYYAYYYAKYMYENYQDVGNLLWDEYAYSYYGYYYASYAYLYDAQDGNNRGFAYLAYVYTYYGYLCGYNAYTYGGGYTYYVMLYNYDACVYSYLVHIGQRSSPALSDLGQPVLDQELLDLELPDLGQQLLDQKVFDLK